LSRLNRVVGLLRSLWIYHGIPGRRARLETFYRQFVPHGGLAFDIGAHVGSRVLAWRRLGAKVVAVEPQPDFVRLLRWLFARDDGVTVLAQAVGRAPGEAQLLISQRTPTVSTLSSDWTERVGTTASFRGVQWTPSASVAVTTLDALIDRFGLPDFVKIDVEGYELEVLHGLTRALSALSFEYLASLPELSLGCIDRLETLGRYRYWVSTGEQFRWLDPNGCGATEMRRWIGALAPDAPSGDIYARRIEGLN
jgi:FkbM family methyltransferase